MKTGKMILVIATATTAGIIIGMLITPEKGSTLRKSIKERGGKLACDLGDIVRQGMSQFEHMRSILANQVTGLEISKQKIRYN